MAQYSLFWDGNTGDGGPYDQADLCDAWTRALCNGTGDRGVLKGWLNELAVTDGGGLNAAVASGAALCYGGFFESDAAVNVAVPNNSTVVVRASRVWANQTIRLSHDAGAGLTQNPPVQYDIPLAEVTTVAGAITVITDLRELCTFSTIPGTASVETDHLQNDAVTTVKIANQTRWLSRGAGCLYADATNPASRVFMNTWSEYPFSDCWQFSDGATDTVWCTFRVPADFTGATVSVNCWVRAKSLFTSGDVRLAFSAWVAAPSGVLANQTGAVTYTMPGFYVDPYTFIYNRVEVGTIPVAAGDLVHMEVYRDGTAGADSFAAECYIQMVEIGYTADS